MAPTKRLQRRPTASSELIRHRMENQKRRDTAEELRIRSLIHKFGLRFRVDVRPVLQLRCRPDLTFPRYRLAVFIDSCFWHGCPKHGTWPKANRLWWRAKIDGNRERDRQSTIALQKAGWRVIRVWTHEDPIKACRRILRATKKSTRPRKAKPVDVSVAVGSALH
jgi:DNA mismatch endonuclease (patch repair protein)